MFSSDITGTASFCSNLDQIRSKEDHNFYKKQNINASSCNNESIQWGINS